MFLQNSAMELYSLSWNTLDHVSERTLWMFWPRIEIWLDSLLNLRSESNFINWDGNSDRKFLNSNEDRSSLVSISKVGCIWSKKLFGLSTPFIMTTN
ncbi:hypothetical protein OGAPHI_002759 [Ogataea philodendri]|uniref:Uncharacterized protein n=1 Tax=Ogataea philodendri TaxID=1378263 RepID=A0A9P8T803_9ASCO|nr:uncharacterized protein OGAPHI_002759 [Ogataea philodendri]KAH3669004.1 hypothetical protein OGAPHI_002759 [Ogataea philodendri]